jgi:hypothetical protein
MSRSVLSPQPQDNAASRLGFLIIVNLRLLEELLKEDPGNRLRSFVEDEPDRNGQWISGGTGHTWRTRRAGPTRR